jgi:O-6-methylguanine DNA methyltransferase
VTQSIVFDEISSPIGPLVLCATENGLCHIEFSAFADAEAKLHHWSHKLLGRDRFVRDRSVLSEAVQQLELYFAGKLFRFDLVLDLQGTPFQRRVWLALSKIHYGETQSYKYIGANIGNPKAVRAVGGANNRNPLPIILPCHRVIGANGDMVGYGGGLPIKRFLLDHERHYINNQSV